MKYQISGSTVFQKQFNVDFHDATWETDQELAKIVSMDWMPAVISGTRKNENFNYSMFLFGDVDNDSDDESTHCSIERFQEIFAGKAYWIITSRNHQKPKAKSDGRISPACDRFHVLFPLEEVVWDGDLLDSMLGELIQTHNFFDPAAKGRCRFYYGVEGAQIIRAEGTPWPVKAQDLLVPEVAVESAHHQEFTDETAMAKILEALPVAYQAGAFKAYHDWIACGQALKHCGADFEVFASITDPAVKNARAKWDSFTATKYTKGTLVAYARVGVPDLLTKGSVQKQRASDTRVHVKARDVGIQNIVGEGQPRSERPAKTMVADEPRKFTFGEGFDYGKPAPIRIFPHSSIGPKGDVKLLSTLENYRALLEYYGIEAKENLMNHRVELGVRGVEIDGKHENAAFGTIRSIASLNGLSADPLDQYCLTICHENCYHPVEDWLDSLPAWDGHDHLGDVMSLLKIKEGYDEKMCRTFLERWMVSAVAAIYERQYRGRGVLVLQGPQSIGKTTFFRNLFPVVSDRAFKFFEEGLTFDAHNKDNIETAISHWVSEFGELEGLFKRSDLSALKAFITKEFDDIRMPYERRAEHYPRRSVFCGTVNQDRFLADDTGNSRFWTIAISGFKKTLDRDCFNLEGIWAQVLSLYRGGMQWWLTQEEEDYLSGINSDHEQVDEVADLIAAHYDLESLADGSCFVRLVNAGQIAREIGYTQPSKGIVNKISATLKRMPFVQAKKSGAVRGFLMPDPLTQDQMRARASRGASPVRREEDPI